MQTQAKLFELLQDIIAGTEDYRHLLAEEIDHAKKVFIIGMGRSGLVGRMFAMRLGHLGISAHVVWDTCTPPINEGDVLIAISNSGTTSSVTNIIEKAALKGAKVILVSSSLEPLTSLPLSHLMFIDVSVANQSTHPFPMGTLFELSAMLYFDLIIAEIIEQKAFAEDQLIARHANLE